MFLTPELIKHRHIMTGQKRNHIYVYDEEQKQIIVIDGETGKKIEQKRDDITAILAFLKEQGWDVKLRKFAVWCAQKANSDLKPIQRKLLELAEKAIDQTATNRQLAELYEATEGTAVATDTVGLRQGSEQAPAFLITRECINPDPLEGAVQAAHFYKLWVEMNAANESQKDESDKNIAPNIEDTREQQINFLLDLIGDKD